MMKSTLVLVYLFLAVLGKNVFDLSKLAALEKSNEKRDAKNVYNLDNLKIGVPSKRDQTSFNQDPQLLTSILPQFNSISIFSGYIRDNEEISRKTENKDESMLIICPTDNAISNKLGGKKPWEFPQPLSGENDDEVIDSNLSYFISNHIVEKLENLKISDDGETVIVAKLLNGREIQISQTLNNIVLNLDDKKINVEFAKQVDNGYIFIIDECLVDQ